MSLAQDTPATSDDVAAEVTGATEAESKKIEVADQVQIEPTNDDDKIERRLQEILDATGWFIDPHVQVNRGVVVLSGQADSAKHQEWAEATAMHTADVVAVVNRITVVDKPIWNFAPAIESLKELGREFTGVLPLMLIAIIIAIVSYYLARVSARSIKWFTKSRIENTLLRQVTGNVVAVFVFVIGLYIALRVSGLTRLAVTLLGGTGLVGLALGFAFRDIAENYLSSILISLNRPFRVGDLIEVDGAKGFVKRVTMRGTVLSTLEGNQIQLPNSTVYKGKITNFTATPLSRKDFSVGIGFDDSITEAQQIIMTLLRGHAAVADEPEPLVIVESLGSATVNLRVFYWFDQTKHSPLKVSSSVIRLAKQELTKAKITMPDEARELVFPQGVPVRIVDSPDGHLKDSNNEVLGAKKASNGTVPQESDAEINVGEGDLSSERNEVMRVTANDELLSRKTNLLE